MTVIGRLWRGGSLLALSAAATMILAVLHCGFVGHDDTHPAAAQAPSAAAVAGHGAAHAEVDHVIGHCPSHAAHCLQAVLPGGGKLGVLQLISFLLAVALGGAAMVIAAAGGVRGPPAGAVPAVGGRDILTRICIARR
ncbi:hypothetical protein [Nocardia transvalensis]|uniref:hypothetical protein n=1 Tax=Nocardia transvalensis TaxID=37333 RepID=UPI0018955EE3|nr:hypothetical protein [Nocardia transvalensis]MBF6328241.1 hypothetical protein [Nocardia transvalensis]